MSENDSPTAEQTLWMRNNNRVAHDLSKFHPHTVGFYQVGDRNGTVVYAITDKSLSSNQSADYAKASINKSVAEFRVELSSLPDIIIQNGSKDDFEKGHAQAFFGFTTADQDVLSHVHKLGSGNTFTFTFEERTGSVTNGSDRDFNYVVMKVTLV
ncbi:MAG: hypothetical protein PUP92_02570 [Rhizonema sp. PD38]|nr:hypothetical protein [Rhizonema sp. PD38]